MNRHRIPPRPPEALEDDLAEALWEILCRLPNGQEALPVWVVVRGQEAYNRWATTKAYGRPDQTGPYPDTDDDSGRLPFEAAG